MSFFKGFRFKIRLGKKEFNPAMQKRTDAMKDIRKGIDKRREKDVESDRSI